MDSMTMAMSPYASRYARVAPGGMRRTNVNPGQAPMAPSGAVPGAPYNPLSLDSNVGKFQDYQREGVEGYGDMVGQDFTKSVGNLLGNLNEIGGLRSGGVQAGINDFATQYGRQIGDYAKMATTEGTRMGQEEYDAATERNYRAEAEKRARKHSLISGIGTVLGGVAGTVLGPAGAAVGAKLGKVVAGKI